MSNRRLVPRGVLVLALSVSFGCRSSVSSPVLDASAPREITVRVPNALRVARSLDSLSVDIDESAGAETTVRADPGMVLGVESEVRVFGRGHPGDSGPGRHGYASGASFDVGPSIWSTRQDGLPQADEKYEAEMKLILFETDVPPGHAWDPHAGQFKILLTRTLRQAEE
jgi:hypothetical protein